MAEAQIHPPSSSRVASARAAGLAPAPTLIGLVGALGVLALAQQRLVPELWSRLGMLLRAPLEAWSRGDAAQAAQLAQALSWSVARSVGIVAMASVACVALGLLLIQGAVFVWPRRARRRFQSARPSFVPGALWGLALSLLLGLTLVDVVWLEPSGLAALLSTWWLRLSWLALGVGLVDAALARERFFRALWLTRREQRDEWREAYGAPEMRSARSEARQSERLASARAPEGARLSARAPEGARRRERK